jgi:hypothetical protein
MKDRFFSRWRHQPGIKVSTREKGSLKLDLDSYHNDVCGGLRWTADTSNEIDKNASVEALTKIRESTEQKSMAISFSSR